MNPFAPEVKACPYPYYESIRAVEPVHWNSELNAWLVTGYPEALAVLMDDVTYSSKNSTSGRDELDDQFPSLITADGVRHRQRRSLVAKAFTPRTLDSLWEGRIREVADDLLDQVESKETFDVIQDVAELPSRIIAEIIGVESDRFEDFKRWSDEIVAASGPSQQEGDAGLDSGAAGESFSGLFAYLAGAVADRRERPQDDLVTRLVDSEIEGVRLTDLEIIAFLELLIVSGNDAITDLIATGTQAIVSHKGLMAKLQRQPSLIADLVEEALRWDSPVQCFYRRATVDADLGEKSIEAGDALLVLYGAANRDPKEFTHPDDFNIQRKRRDHLAFGMGMHYCLGASLTRLQARVAIEAIVERFDSLSEIPGFETKWRDTPFFRGRVAYPLKFVLRQSNAQVAQYTE